MRISPILWIVGACLASACATSNERRLEVASVRVCVPPSAGVASRWYVQSASDPGSCFVVEVEEGTAREAVQMDGACDELGWLDGAGTESPARPRAGVSVRAEGSVAASGGAGGGRYDYDFRLTVVRGAETQILRAAGFVDGVVSPESGCFARTRVAP